jgi:hypothetical protein
MRNVSLLLLSSFVLTFAAGPVQTAVAAEASAGAATSVGEGNMIRSLSSVAIADEMIE